MIEQITFELNGETISVELVPGEFLADLLRYRLELTGTKIGCNEAECGACTVLVNDLPVLSCSYPTEKVNGKKVLTIEGLSKGDSTLHPLQQAFVSYGAIQCGFCTSGLILSAYSLLLRNPEPSSNDIREALKDNLCRCGGYPSIEQAILAAASSMRSGKPIESMQIGESIRSKNIIGHSLPRPDAVDKATGRAKYSDDIHFDGMLWGAVKRAGIAHGKVKNINLEDALRIPGVVAILGAKDIPGVKNHGIVIQDWPVLVGIGERVRYVGDAVAIVAAINKEVAVDACEAIKVDYELLPVISDPITSKKTDSIQLHPNGNLLKHIQVSKGSIEDGFKDSEFMLEREFTTPTTDHAFLEPECSVARVDSDGNVEIYVGSQIPYADRTQTAKVLGIPEEKVRIIGMLIGGGFGGKEDIATQIHAAMLAQATKRPIKMLFERKDSFLVHPKRHATRIKVKVGCKQDGRIQAIKTELYGDTGAYASLGEKVMTRATTHSSGPYEVKHIEADCFAMYTNNPPAGAFRGFGVTQSAFAIESVMDILAKELRLSPIEFRKMNCLRIGSVTNTGQLLKESVGLLECIEKVEQRLAEIGGDSPFLPREVPGSPGKVRSWGFALAYKNSGLGGGAPDEAGALIELYPDGCVEIRSSSAEIGQGLVTVLQMIVAEELSLPLDDVRVLLSDTGLTPDGGPTTASRQTFVTGNAALGAALSLKQALYSYYSEKFDVSPQQIKLLDGFIQAGNRKIEIGDYARKLKSEGKEARVAYKYVAPQTQPLGMGGDMHFAYSFAAQAVEVEVDKLTGAVKVTRVISATDVGTALNPLGLKGQIEGGIMMGIGNALYEKFIVENGIVITDRMAKYRIPSIMNTPHIVYDVVEHPVEAGPFGAKGVGEIVSIPTTPAITNAIYNAVGVRIVDLPVDQEYILEHMEI